VGTERIVYLTADNERRESMERRKKNETRALAPDAQVRAETHLSLAEALACEQFNVCRGAMPLDELLGEARLALTCAASCYDATPGVPFGAYATLVIRRWLIQAVTVWRRVERLYQARLTDLDAGKGGPRAVDVPCPRTRDPSQLAADRELIERVRRVLPPRWFVLLRLYYVDRHTLEEIGRQIGVSRERVRTLLAEAIRRARQRCQGKHSDPTPARSL
jgi:RNA polymerase sigma factor (sigma-70 family)